MLPPEQTACSTTSGSGTPTRGDARPPRDDDLQVFAWLTELMNVEGLPALMMIVGDGGH